VTYAVKEIYYTLQGEGAQTGRPAVFLRFAGCNLWTGREADRATAVCQFCDTDFFGTDGPGGGKFDTSLVLAQAVAAAWPHENAQVARYVVCTGGEPALQLDEALLEALHDHQFKVAIETNGTLAVSSLVDWVCVSPKAGAPFEQRSGDELKLVYPQEGLDPGEFEHLEFPRFCLQPMDGPQWHENTALAVAYCKAHPKWRLSLQTHKLIGIP